MAHTSSSNKVLPTANAVPVPVRLDVWLWAARFYKTRSSCKAAIEGGMVHCSGVRAKVSKSVNIGDELTIRQGFDKKTVIVQALSNQRRGADIAQQLYTETPESLQLRQHYIQQRKLNNLARHDTRPTKKDRRQFTELLNEGFDN